MEDQFRKDGLEILARLQAISKWIESKRLEIPKSEMIIEHILNVVIAEVRKLSPQVIHKPSPIKV